ncbi:SpoIID/LytB domain-containing protein [Paratissierella segnis]|jgi:stage II sporulation protein D|uniref:SpoIID/LytB domain-containing protein n=1 Tax=Paratissierella segnis TaxID=2763679 RepID=A0A926IKN5_9FIRM|nr:SpoIID/LytB domain-containing protein [Paratissierella segnis]MBC8588691.1 SpoIID/LytB domain-containing protein [Paratissierella segnis]
MKKFILLIISFILLIPYISFGATQNGTYLNVKIGNNINISENISLSADNGFYLYDKNSKREITYIENNHLIAKGNQNGIIEIYDQSYNYITEISGDGSVILGSGNTRDSIVQVDQNKYRDYITFLVRNNEILLLNHIELDNYLYGVLPREIPASSPIEALKAQAIASRSYTMANINKHINEGYNLCDKVHCQVYGAYDNENPATNQAVDETKGTYAYYDGKIIDATFHSTSGGYTEDSSNVWGNSVPYLVAVEDEFSANTPNSNWTVEITARELKDKLLSSGVDIGDIIEIQLLDITEANRVQKLKIKGTKGEHILSSSNFRNLVGASFLKSTWFNVSTTGASSNTKVYALSGDSTVPREMNLDDAYILNDANKSTVSRDIVSRAIGKDRTSSLDGKSSSKPTTFVFNGKGYGHGVGMSQYGAIEMAKQGYNYEDIIKHYYKDVELINEN